MDNEKSYDLWASCDPNADQCDGGGDDKRIRINKHLWSSTNDDGRKNLEWKGTISFDIWVRITHGRIEREEKWKLWDALNGPSNVEEPTIVKDKTSQEGNLLEKKHWCEQIKTRNNPKDELWAS